MPLTNRGTWITLTDEQTIEADDIGLLRQQNAEDEKRKPGNNLISTWANDLRISILGARGERAGKVYFDPIVWHSFKRGSLGDLPDLGNFIDIKTVPQRRVSKLIVKKGGVRSHWAYVLCSAWHHPRYRLIGWMWGKDLINVPLIEPQPNRPAHVIDEDSPLLLELDQLRDMVR